MKKRLAKKFSTISDTDMIMKMNHFIRNSVKMKSKKIKSNEHWYTKMAFGRDDSFEEAFLICMTKEQNTKIKNPMIKYWTQIGKYKRCIPERKGDII